MNDKSLDTSLDSAQMIDVSELSRLTKLHPATLWRHHEAGLIPAGCKIGRSVRWRLRTGDPATGVMDWLEAGCPSRAEAGSVRDNDQRVIRVESLPGDNRSDATRLYSQTDAASLSTSPCSRRN